jgi:hypothetical protein
MPVAPPDRADRLIKARAAHSRKSRGGTRFLAASFAATAARLAG